MGIKSCLNLLIISVVLGQGIAVALEENKEVSSFLLRPKRSSREVAKSSTEASSSSSTSEIEGYLNPPRPGLEVGSYNPGRWEGRLPPGMVRIYRGTYEVGLGVMVNEIGFATKAHIFPLHIQPGEFHVEYSDRYGVHFSQDVKYVEVHPLYRQKKQKPWGSDDVCYGTITEDPYLPMANPELPVPKSVTTLLRKARIFTLKQSIWIASRTGCNHRTVHFAL